MSVLVTVVDDAAGGGVAVDSTDGMISRAGAADITRTRGDMCSIAESSAELFL